ncbi:MAG: alpha/beta hydrolase [Patescibacteria group bacterium]
MAKETNKQQVFYIHGGEAYSNYEAFLSELKTREIRNLPNSESLKKWSSSLAEDLGEDFEVFSPQMPNAMNAKYEEWKIWFERHFEYLKNEVILVGWSLGAMFFVRYLSENETPFTIKHLFLIAGAYQNIDAGKMKEDGGDFFTDSDVIPNIQYKVDGISIFHSKDDFVVTFEHAEKYKSALPEATLHAFETRNHFLIEEFPELLELIKSVAK